MGDEWVAEKKQAESLLFGGNGNGPMDLDADSDFGPETNVDYVDSSVNGTDLKHRNTDPHPLILPAGKTIKEDRKTKSDRDSDEEDEEEEEDERWDYIKGDIKEEESSLHKGLNNHPLVDADHALNPNAAEFVPTSPVEKSSSFSVTNSGLTNNVPFSPDACKSAFFENSSNPSVCDLNKANYEFSRGENDCSATNGIGKDGLDMNSFEGIKVSEHLNKGPETDAIDHSPVIQESHVNDLFTAPDPLKPNSNPDFFTQSDQENHKDEAEDSVLLNDHINNSACNESAFYSDISAENPHDFSDPADSSKVNNLEYSAISPEKPHEFSLLENASNQTTETDKPADIVVEHPPTVNGSDFGHLDPFSSQTESKSNPFGNFGTENIEKAGNDFFTSDETFECKMKDNLSKLKKDDLVFSPDEEFERKMKDNLGKLKTSDVVFSPDENLECKRKDNLSPVKTDELVFSLSSDVDLSKESKGVSLDKYVIQDSIEKNAENIFGITESLKHTEVKPEAPVFGSDFTSEPVFEEKQPDDFSSSNLLVSEGDKFGGSKFSNETFTAEEFSSTETAQNVEPKEIVEPNIELGENLQNVPGMEVEFGKDVCSNPFSDFSNAKESEESSVLNKTFVNFENFDGVTTLSEGMDAFGINEPTLKTEVQETEDLLCYRENIVQDTKAPVVDTQEKGSVPVTTSENPFFSEEIQNVSETIQNLEITESIHASTPFNEDISNTESKEAEKTLDIQDDQALISQLTDKEEFSNSVDVVNKLTEEYEKSEGAGSTADSDLTKVAMAAGVAGVAAAAAGVAAGVVADKTKKPTTTPLKKTAAKTDIKNVAAKSKPAASKPAASLQPATKPAAKSPAASPRKPIPPKASPAKTSLNVTRATPSAVLKSKVAATTASTAAAKPKLTATAAAKPKTTLTATKPNTTATTRPRTTLAPTSAATKPAAKPLTNGVASRPTSTLSKRPATAPSAPRPPTTTARTSTAPKPLPRTAAAPKTSATTKPTTTTTKPSLSSRPATTIPPRRPLSAASKAATDKPTRTSSATPRTALTARKLDTKKTSATSSNDASKTAQTKPPPIKRIPPKTNQTEVKTETVVANGSIEPKDDAVETS